MEKLYYSLPDPVRGKLPDRKATKEECLRAELILDHWGVCAMSFHCEDRWYGMIMYEHAKGARVTDPDMVDMDPGAVQAMIASINPLPKRFEPYEIIQCSFRLHDAYVIFYSNLPLAKQLAENQVD